MANDQIYQVLRESLALRPPPSELADVFLRRQTPTADGPHRVFSGDDLGKITQRLLRPSDRASDLNHPVGRMAMAIRIALPDFQDWTLDPAAPARFLTFTGEHRDRLRIVLPPGFAEGRPGAFLRATRALVFVNENRSSQSVYEHLQDSPDERTFRAGRKNIRLSDVIDLNWMAAGSLELRSVQEVVERLTAAVLPGSPARFSTYDEPRYRSAFELHLGAVSARAACGGVLAEWPGRPPHVDAAHVRLFLEPWAAIQSGQDVEFTPPPEIS